MTLQNALLNTTIIHDRTAVRKNKFRYKASYILLHDQALPPSTALFGINRWGLAQFLYQDYGEGSEKSPFVWVKNILKSFQIKGIESIYFLTQPRQYGYIFNPANFYFCLKKSQVWALVIEVHNTFGEKHFYVIGNGKKPLKEKTWYKALKTFHVSPFFDVKGSYEFSFVFGKKSLGVWINYYLQEQIAFRTSITGRYEPFTPWGILRHFILKPWTMIKVPFLIHWQALILWSRGISWFSKPSPPKHSITPSEKNEGRMTQEPTND